jgi:ElaB/YqjD/DUF883 family membrane-anchored ribosome-binding protein
MANTGDQGGTNPSAGTHPRMTAGMPQGPGGGAQTSVRTEHSSDVTRRVGDALETAREGISQGAQYVAEQARTLWSDTAHLVRRHPMQALGVTLGVGFLLGCCMTAFFGSSGDSMTRRMSRSSA